jgi:hypothetical protein
MLVIILKYLRNVTALPKIFSFLTKYPFIYIVSYIYSSFKNKFAHILIKLTQLTPHSRSQRAHTYILIKHSLISPNTFTVHLKHTHNTHLYKAHSYVQNTAHTHLYFLG